MATITNQATLCYNGITTLSNVAVGELVEALTVTKNASIDTYLIGDTLTYVVTLVNSCTVPLCGLTLTDNMGAYTFCGCTLYPTSYVCGSLLYYNNGILQPAPLVEDGPPLSICGINVPGCGSTVLVYQARVTETAPPCADDCIVNVVTVDGPGLTTPVTATETVTASSEPVLTISKSLSPAMVTEKCPLSYTLVIQNRGNTAATAADCVVITDIFDPALCDICVTFNGCVWTEGDQFCYNELLGRFVTTAGAITVPAATCAQNPHTGAYCVTPGTSTLVIRGTL